MVGTITGFRSLLLMSGKHDPKDASITYVTTQSCTWSLSRPPSLRPMTSRLRGDCCDCCDGNGHRCWLSGGQCCQVVSCRCGDMWSWSVVGVVTGGRCQL